MPSLLNVLDVETFLQRFKDTNECIGGDNMKERLDSTTLDSRGRFMVTQDDAERVEPRWSYGAKGRSAFAFNNGKTENSFPAQWASEATRPTTVVIEAATRDVMRCKRTVEDQREYSTTDLLHGRERMLMSYVVWCLRKFTNAQFWPTWSISTSLCRVTALRRSVAHARVLQQ
ncbi:hypothetical protein V8E36_003820 [Tilletia maclaganii]